jgi:hypothetical protein
MNEQTEDFKQKQKLLQDELQKYKDSKKPYKPYMQCMDEVSAWLQGMAK